jgi:hypothetical protein
VILLARKATMPAIADYPISDDEVELETGGDIDHTYSFDLGTAVKHAKHAILQFLLQTHNAKSLRLRTILNGGGFSEFTVQAPLDATITEALAGWTKDGVNELTIEIRTGTGRVVISSVVLSVERAV